ncbi:hypothetical protein KR018_011679 [Drosophila ironensis]|nr:hypothetical protein KR018_011679 [Drosophila ironensis]
MEGLLWSALIAYSVLALVPQTSGRSCSRELVLKASNLEDEEPQIDLSRLSGKQLLQLLRQLTKLQSMGQNEDQVEDEDLDAKENLIEYEDDHRGIGRPWNKVQRIIRRQLVKIPKRYLKKLLRQFGLARSAELVRSGDASARFQLEEYYLIPLE